MEDLRPLYQLIEDTRKAVSEGNSELAEKIGWEMCNQFEESYQVDEATYTPVLKELWSLMPVRKAFFPSKN